MSELELTYLAGFFDGEGCISIAHRKDRYYELSIYITQKDPSILECIQKQFGGSLQSYDHTTEFSTGIVHNLVWHGDSAMNTLKLLLPHLHVKRYQAMVAIEFQSYRDLNRGNRYKSLTKENIAVYKACCDKLCSLK